MLVLTRKPGEQILIGDSVRVTVVSVAGSRVKLAFSAPKEVPIHRGELYDSIQADSRDTDSRPLEREIAWS